VKSQHSEVGENQALSSIFQAGSILSEAQLHDLRGRVHSYLKTVNNNRLTRGRRTALTFVGQAFSSEDRTRSMLLRRPRINGISTFVSPNFQE
jgi:hypothetical protein